MPSPPVLHTPRLVLRPLRTKDAPVIQKRFANWEVVLPFTGGRDPVA